MTNEELLFYDAIKNNPINAQVYPIDLGVLVDFQENGVLNFDLPNQTTIYSAKAISIETYSNTEYTWYGSLIGGNEDEQGTVLLVAKDNRIDGRISVDSNVYLIQSIGEGKNVFIDVDEEKFTANECGVMSTGNPVNLQDETINNIVETRDECLDLPIRVLFLYSDAADDVGNPSSAANMIIAQLNQITKNSGINYSDDLRFTNAGVANLASLSESNLINTDIDLLSLPTSPPPLVYTDANNLRDQYEADLVVVFTDGDYSCGTGCFVYGTVQSSIAAPGVVLGGEALPFAIVEIDAAISRFTAVHEIGHLMGGRHQQCSEWSNGGCDDEPEDAHGEGWGEKPNWWNKWKNYSTVMHQLRSGNTRIENFSNPDIEHNPGYPTGTLGLRNNARVFGVNGCAIAQYRDFDPPLSASISGINWVIDPGPHTWTANVQNGTPSYIYQWSYSTDGFNYFLSANNYSSTLTMLMPPGDYEKLYLRLDVQDSDGNGGIATAFYQVIYASDCGMCLIDNNSNPLESTLSDSKSSTIVYPNPASNVVQIIFEIKKTEEGNVDIALSNFNGKLIKKLRQGYLKEGKYFINMPLDNAGAGIHLIKIIKEGNIESKKLFIVR